MSSNSDSETGTASSVSDLTKRNIELIAELENTAKSERTQTDRAIDSITSFVGSLKFVWVHVVWFALWMGLNLIHRVHFDPYPFNLLTLIVSLEAILLSTFILISQNRQSRISERRSHLDLQINLLSEQENTKMLSMLIAITKHLKIDDDHSDTEVMLESTEPKNLVEQIQDIIEGEQKAESDQIDNIEESSV